MRGRLSCPRLSCDHRNHYSVSLYPVRSHISLTRSQPSMDTRATTNAAIMQANKYHHCIGCFIQDIIATKDTGHRSSDSTITTADVGSLSRPGQDFITWVITDTIKAITPMAINRYDTY